MAEPFIAEIRMFGGNFAPVNWAFCDGSLLSISQNSALFSLLGTTFGGNGTTNFALPDLRGRVPVHAGSGPGLSPYALGQSGGTETVNLSVAQMPAHNHLVQPNCTAGVPQSPVNDPANAFPAATESSTGGPAIYGTPAGATMGATPSAVAGGSQPHPNIQPYLCVNFIIALQGIYPSRS